MGIVSAGGSLHGNMLTLLFGSVKCASVMILIQSYFSLRKSLPFYKKIAILGARILLSIKQKEDNTMANFYCVQRSNYFHVKDPDNFREGMKHVCGEDIHFWEETDEAGAPVFGFGSYGKIDGMALKDENGDWDMDDESYAVFVKFLQQSVTEDDAVIILCAGHEKLRYVTGYAEVITAKDYQTVDLDFAASTLACSLLNDH